MKPPFLRTEFNYDMHAASKEHGLKCTDPTLAKQSFKDEVDINTIVKRFNITGELPQGVRMPTYGDFTEITDFQSAMNAIAQANEAFDAMPAEVRARFQNDPAQFVDFCSNPNNRTEAEKLGLVPYPVTEPTGSTPPPEAPKTPQKAPTGEKAPPSQKAGGND